MPIIKSFGVTRSAAGVDLVVDTDKGRDVTELSHETATLLGHLLLGNKPATLPDGYQWLDKLE